MTLKKYNEKRDFKKTPEPLGVSKKNGKNLTFVIQKHEASQLHYDLRLQIPEGRNYVMKSWAIPKGPSLDPTVKRLAIQVEDHPISYNTFEGRIPEGQYGGGEVIVWDQGVYHSENTYDGGESEREFVKGLNDGRLKFILHGKKLRGGFILFRFQKDNQWILMKQQDEYATTTDITQDARSVISDRVLIGKKEKIAQKTPSSTP